MSGMRKTRAKKIRSTFKAKGNSGKHVASTTPYGYLKDPDNKEHWIVDEEAAQVVRRTFSDDNGRIWSLPDRKEAERRSGGDPGSTHGKAWGRIMAGKSGRDQRTPMRGVRRRWQGS